ncbi:MAG: OmpA family protein [Actinomycetota bacterium]
MTDQYVDEDQEDDAYDYYSDEELEEEVQDARDLLPVEGRTSWIYLIVLGAVFVVLVFFSWACNDRSSTAGEPITEEAAEEAAGGASVDLQVTVDGDVVTLFGAVPDDAAEEQILQVAGELYGAENVIDEVDVQDSATLDGGTLTVGGSASFDDSRPQALRDQLLAGLGLSDVGFDIDRGEASVSAVVIDGALDDGLLTLAGAVPDQVSVDDLVAAVETIWGPGSADVSGIVIGDATWTDGVVRVTGTARPGDSRIQGLEAEIQRRFGALVTVDTTAVGLDQSPAALAEIQDEITAELAVQPIRFAPLLAEIEEESDAVLVSIAEKLNTIPDVVVEVVGHTDNAGAEAANQVLSEQRATAVVERLTELGVDPTRLNARGEGELIPIADNDTPEGREQNRRIEFLLVAQ